MQLFLIFFTAGILPCWFYVKNKNSWLHTGIGIVFGLVGAYAAVYIMGNFVQANLVAEMNRTVGESAARDIINGIYGSAFKSAAGAIIGVAIALKLKNAKLVSD